MTNQDASSLGKIGGKARAKALTPQRRKEIALMGSQARWKGHKKRPPTAK